MTQPQFSKLSGMATCRSSSRLLAADPRLVRASDEYLKTPLHWAAEHDRRDVC
jgi:hypothetical protein